MNSINTQETYSTIKTIGYFVRDFYTILCGLFVSAIGSLLPIKNIVHLLILFFILDIIFGYWAAKILRKERFSVKIIWGHTMPRLLISIIIVTGAFMWDLVYEQTVVSTYKIIGWFISGILLLSIAENGYEITRWRAFRRIGSLISEGIKNKTGQECSEEIENKNQH